MAGRRDGAVVVHCNARRDRAGLVLALLLDALGVARGEIAADFASSPPIEGHPGASARVMLEVLEALDRTAGGSRGYLATAGLDPAALETVGLL
jgi:protein-tyrosine phosphatase